MHAKAPKAKVAILSYPWIMPATVGCFDKMPIATGDVPYVRGIQATLNDAVRRAAAATGVDLRRPQRGLRRPRRLQADRHPLGRARPAGHQPGDRAPQRPRRVEDGGPDHEGPRPALSGRRRSRSSSSETTSRSNGSSAARRRRYGETVTRWVSPQEQGTSIGRVSEAGSVLTFSRRSSPAVLHPNEITQP